MRLFTVLVIFRKELLDMLRDKRTLIAMIGIPVVIYPALFIAGSQAVILQQGRVAGGISRVGVEGAGAPVLRQWMSDIPKVHLYESQDPRQDLIDGKLHALIVAEEDINETLKRGGTAKIRILYDAAEGDSLEAEHRVAEGLDTRYEKLLDERLRSLGVQLEYARPIDVVRKNVATPAKSTGSILGMMMPLIMIVMLGIGALVPAVDLTAGEKERGTFETLLSTPTSSLEILAGKFLTVFCLAMFTGALNLGSMILALAIQLSQMEQTLGEFSISLPMRSVILIALALAPLAFFISAVMMSIATLARSFREAQNLLAPFLLLLLFPAALAAVPGISLSASTQFIPIVNVALLFKDLMTERVGIQPVFMVLASTTLYAVLALLLAAKLFQREEVVLSQDRGVPFTFRRSRFTPRTEPTPGTALFLFTVSLLLLYYVGTYVQGLNTLAGLAVTQWGLFLLPTLALLWFLRIDLKSALNLRRPTSPSLIGAAIAACGWVVLSLQIGVWQQKVLPFPEELAKEMSRMLGMADTPLPLLLLVLAVSPAICEEALFRGALLSGFRKHMPAWLLLLLVGFLFGLAHLSVHRLLITGVSGFVLAFIVLRSGSLFPGMVAHFIVNASSILIETNHVPQFIERFVGPAVREEKGFPLLLLAAAAAVFLTGLFVIRAASPSRNLKD